MSEYTSEINKTKKSKELTTTKVVFLSPWAGDVQDTSPAHGERNTTKENKKGKQCVGVQNYKRG
jgi:hypothetical protein